jgi:putative ABC transport system substrate-binding protein
MRRRDFIALIGGAATAWPFAAQAQRSARMQRIGFLVSALPADDSEFNTRATAFVQALAQLGWIDGRNMRLDYRFGLGDAERQRKYAAELVALAPDVLVAAGASAVAALQMATRTLPIVFANFIDPVGSGFVASLARPGGNVTGFMSVEFGLSAKLLELLKQLAPPLMRVGVVRSQANINGIGQFGAIQSAARSFGVELTPLIVHDTHDTEQIGRDIAAFASRPNSGLIVIGGALQQTQRGTIIAAAAQYKIPAVYPFRGYVTEGGLISYGVDQAEPYRLAAGYVDRILKGEKPADLPVQAPTKYETVINLKTAKALGLTVPATLLVAADEVIE